MTKPPSIQSVEFCAQNGPAQGEAPDPRPQILDPNPLSQRWLCLSVRVPHEAAETVASLLVELGSHGVVEGVRELVSLQQSTTEVQGFFPCAVDRLTLCDAVTRHLSELFTQFPYCVQPIPHLTEVANDAWAESWREHFPPIEIGKRFLLLPPWEPVPKSSGRLVIVINPSMAFGTGHHATTQGCLEAIEMLHEQNGAPAQAVDLGTGSGILAIALAKLGTKTVWATDIEPIAREEARNNAQLNNVGAHIYLSDAPIESLPGPFPLVVANLFATTLTALAPALQAGIGQEGYTILSGIQRDQEADVHAAYHAPIWRLHHRFARDDWVTLVLQRM